MTSSDFDGRRSCGSARWFAVFAAVLTMAGLAEGVRAQDGWSLAGRIIDVSTGVGLPNAQVRLEGVTTVLSDESGIFLLRDVAPGRYRLSAGAFGYAENDTTVAIRGDTVVVVALTMLPIELDSLAVTLRTIDVDGVVREQQTGFTVARADISSDQGHRESSSLSGRFRLDDVYDGPPLRVSIRGFGYLPMDTAFIPTDEGRHPFDLAPDPIAIRMISGYIDLLDQRAGENMYRFQGALNREDLARFSGDTSLLRVMEAHFDRHILRRIRCFFVDETEYAWYNTREGRLSLLEGTVAGDLERVELLEFPGEDRLFMARIYTRRFFQRQVGSPEDLVAASVTATWGGTFCK